MEVNRVHLTIAGIVPEDLIPAAHLAVSRRSPRVAGGQ